MAFCAPIRFKQPQPTLAVNYGKGSTARRTNVAENGLLPPRGEDRARAGGDAIVTAYHRNWEPPWRFWPACNLSFFAMTDDQKEEYKPKVPGSPMRKTC